MERRRSTGRHVYVSLVSRSAVYEASPSVGGRNATLRSSPVEINGCYGRPN